MEPAAYPIRKREIMKIPTALAELDRAECLRLLGTAAVGRIVFTEGALPAIRPVNFLLDGDDVVFRTATGSALAAATRHAVVAFEVDEIDTVAHTGWSVVVLGQAYEIADIDRLVRLAGPDHAPWVPHRSAHTIAIPICHISGCRLVLQAPT
ncbi:MAG TPA: pyridoxamine 5'-phosphate oxidase family protein [Pseudonocardiaceae bacterium]|jgi:nitroimidazol reductase NimA-like FMN-containing flavoprotein (pyridoxamine 5'-phosphate oxidase superfamily)|nr:pyridoxamine 5'-phosphate oxidase family protein [Pseudonocardiaceae bacterium]